MLRAYFPANLIVVENGFQLPGIRAIIGLHRTPHQLNIKLGDDLLKHTPARNLTTAAWENHYLRPPPYRHHGIVKCGTLENPLPYGARWRAPLRQTRLINPQPMALYFRSYGSEFSQFLTNVRTGRV